MLIRGPLAAPAVEMWASKETGLTSRPEGSGYVVDNCLVRKQISDAQDERRLTGTRANGSVQSTREFSLNRIVRAVKLLLDSR
jgi:hypothetical protein